MNSIRQELYFLYFTPLILLWVLLIIAKRNTKIKLQIKEWNTWYSRKGIYQTTKETSISIHHTQFKSLEMHTFEGSQYRCLLAMILLSRICIRWIKKARTRNICINIVLVHCSLSFSLTFSLCVYKLYPMSPKVHIFLHLSKITNLGFKFMC